MSKKAFYIYLAFLVALVLLSLSPFAALGGIVVTVFLFIPLMFVLRMMGFEISGDTVDSLIATTFIGFSVFLALLAFWQFYRAAAASDRKENNSARAGVAIGCTLLCFPVVIYLCFKALPGI